jgi:hypothetical protein
MIVIFITIFKLSFKIKSITKRQPMSLVTNKVIKYSYNLVNLYAPFV